MQSLYTRYYRILLYILYIYNIICKLCYSMYAITIMHVSFRNSVCTSIIIIQCHKIKVLQEGLCKLINNNITLSVMLATQWVQHGLECL